MVDVVYLYVQVLVIVSMSRELGSFFSVFFFLQAEDGIRDLVRSRGLGDVYKRQVYSTTIGYDYDHIRLPEERGWLREAAESRRFRPPQEPLDPLWLLDLLTRAEAFEHFLHRIFPGKTRFSVCLLYTSDAADERSSVDLGGRRILKKQN